MAARKKKAPTRKTTKRAAPARKPAAPAKKRATRRELPNDEAWRELIATAIEQPDPEAQAARPQAGSAKAAGKSAKTRKARNSRK